MNVRTLLVQHGPDGLLTMTENSEIRAFPDPEAVVAWVRRRDRAAARRGVDTATVVTWDGVIPPAEAER